MRDFINKIKINIVLQTKSSMFTQSNLLWTNFNITILKIGFAKKNDLFITVLKFVFSKKLFGCSLEKCMYSDDITHSLHKFYIQLDPSVPYAGYF